MAWYSKLRDLLHKRSRKSSREGHRQEKNSSNASKTSIPNPSTSEETVINAPGGDTNPWAKAYVIFKNQQRELAADYQEHVQFIHGTAGRSVDFTSPRSVNLLVAQLLNDRDNRQWQIPFGDSVRIREQVEKLTKFLLWTEPIVKEAVSAQPYAALAWSGVSLLLPVC